MKKELIYQDDQSDKFWNIIVIEDHFTVTYGKSGTNGRSQTKTFENEEQCLKEAEKIIAEKIRKGYVEKGQISTIVSKPKTLKQSDQKAVLEEYDELIQKSDIHGLLPFLQTRVKGHSEAVKKNIRKAKRYWIDYRDLSKDADFKGGDRYSIKGSEIQQRIIVLSAIALFNRTEINSWDEVIDVLSALGEQEVLKRKDKETGVLNELKNEDLFKILEWSKPNWIVSFLLEKTARQDWIRIDYSVLRMLEDKGIIEYDPELFARMLPHRNMRNNLVIYENYENFSEYILSDTKTVKRDIPELFNYETVLYTQYFQDPITKQWDGIVTWERIFNTLIQEGKIDRLWFIEKCLLIQTKEWNPNLRSFFRKRILDIQPTNEELIQLQHTIFPLLQASLSVVVNFGIDLFKKIFEEKKFETKVFLEWSESVMMRENCKGGIKALLILFEKIAKKQPKFKPAISLLAADVFMISDLTLQERAVKTIEKTGDVKDEELKNKLGMYASQLQGNSRTQLTAFLEEDAFSDVGEQEEYVFNPERRKVLLEENKVLLPQNWKDILFQFGKFISSKEVIDAELLLNSLIVQTDLFPEDAKEQLQPYVKKLQKTYFEGNYKNIMRQFLLQKIENPKGVYKEENKFLKHSLTISSLFHLLNATQFKQTNQSKLPLLSFPTHYPYWIAPKTLIERLLQHQEADEFIDSVDLAIAISRMPRENVAEAVSLCDKLDTDMADLLRYCLGEHTTIKVSKDSFFNRMMTNKQTNKINTKNAYWALAARTFYPLADFSEFEKTDLAGIPFVTSPFYPKLKLIEKWSEWRNYQTKETERSASWYEMDFVLPAFQKKPDVLLYSLDLYDKGKNHWNYGLSWAEDVAYWHSITPQNDDALAVSILKSAGRLADENNNDLTGFLHIMLLPEFWFTDNSMIVLACSFFKKKKETRLLAGEVLIHVIQEQKIEIDTLAKKVGFLISKGYAPLQRFLETVSMSKEVSSMHNVALVQLLDGCLQNLRFREKLPVGLKKYLELYFDLITKTNHKVTEKALEVINSLNTNTSLKGIIKQIISH